MAKENIDPIADLAELYGTGQATIKLLISDFIVVDTPPVKRQWFPTI